VTKDYYNINGTRKEEINRNRVTSNEGSMKTGLAELLTITRRRTRIGVTDKLNIDFVSNYIDKE